MAGKHGYACVRAMEGERRGRFVPHFCRVLDGKWEERNSLRQARSCVKLNGEKIFIKLYIYIYINKK